MSHGPGSGVPFMLRLVFPNRGKQETAASLVRSLKRRDQRDLQHLQNSDERTQGHIYHKRRKWKCRKCGRVRMQEQKSA